MSDSQIKHNRIGEGTIFLSIFFQMQFLIWKNLLQYCSLWRIWKYFFGRNPRSSLITWTVLGLYGYKEGRKEGMNIGREWGLHVTFILKCMANTYSTLYPVPYIYISIFQERQRGESTFSLNGQKALTLFFLLT